MLFLEENPPLSKIYDILYRLGFSADYTGFFYTSYAVWLSVRQPERLLLVTKWLYPDVARHYGTNWLTVERNIRTVASVAWGNNPRLLSELAGYTLTEKPTASQFISILTRGIFPDYIA